MADAVALLILHHNGVVRPGDIVARTFVLRYCGLGCCSRLVRFATVAGWLNDRPSVPVGTRSSGWVEFEGFLSDYLVACINRDSKRFAVAETQRVSASVSSRFSDELSEHVKVEFPNHVNLDAARRMLDTEGRNKTFKDSDQMIAWVKQNLAETYVNRFENLTRDHLRVLDTTRLVRNYIGHQSTSSREKMNAALAEMRNHAGTQDLYRGNHEVHRAGKYLRTVIEQPYPPRRLHRYLSWIDDTIGKLGAL